MLGSHVDQRQESTAAIWNNNSLRENTPTAIIFKDVQNTANQLQVKKKKWGEMLPLPLNYIQL